MSLSIKRWHLLSNLILFLIVFIYVSSSLLWRWRKAYYNFSSIFILLLLFVFLVYILQFTIYKFIIYKFMCSRNCRQDLILLSYIINIYILYIYICSRRIYFFEYMCYIINQFFYVNFIYIGNHYFYIFI